MGGGRQLGKAFRYLLSGTIRDGSSLQDAGVHGFDVFHHDVEQLIDETKHQLEKIKPSNWVRIEIRANGRDSGAFGEDLLSYGEGLVVEELQELFGHLVGVVGAAVDGLLLQEVDLHRHVADAAFGLVKLVVCNCEEENTRRENQRPSLKE